jgi:hypothetical protein
MIDSTRILPVGAMRQANSKRRSSATLFMTLYIDNASSDEQPVAGVLEHRQLGVRAALRLDGGLMAVPIDGFTVGHGTHPEMVDPNVSSPEQHSPRRHVMNDSVQRID